MTPMWWRLSTEVSPMSQCCGVRAQPSVSAPSVGHARCSTCGPTLTPPSEIGKEEVCGSLWGREGLRSWCHPGRRLWKCFLSRFFPRQHPGRPGCLWAPDGFSGREVGPRSRELGTCPRPACCPCPSAASAPGRRGSWVVPCGRSFAPSLSGVCPPPLLAADGGVPFPTAQRVQGEDR